MKSLTLTASYLWKDIWSGWFERPGSLLSKALVTAILGGLATILLIAFSLLEKDMQNRLEAFGLNTIVVSETLSPRHARFHQPAQPDPLLAPLQQQGSLQLFRALITPIHGPQMERLTTWILPETDFLKLHGGQHLSATPPALLLTQRYPEGRIIPIQTHNLTFAARVVHHLPSLRALPEGEKLLIADGVLPTGMEPVVQEYHLFRLRNGNTEKVRFWIQNLERLYQLEQRPQVFMQSSLLFQEQLENLQQRQILWRAFLALLLGAVLSLVLGSLSFLEYQQNQYVNALFRSFGAPSFMIFLRFLLESLLIINLFILASLALTRILHPVLFGTLEFPPAVLYGDLTSVYLSREILFIFLWSNLGGLLSVLPVGWMLRKPIGSVLS